MQVKCEYSYIYIEKLSKIKNIKKWTQISNIYCWLTVMTSRKKFLDGIKENFNKVISKQSLKNM